jgi:hypothetical protein
MSAPRGHNESAMRLGILADDAKQALARVERGEADTFEGWLAYGAALNEGRSLFRGDREFGEWIALSQLGTRADGEEIKRDDRLAAMWAAANLDQFEEARAQCKARTVRGVHDHWKKIEAERERAAREEEARQKAEAEKAAKAAVAEAARKEAEAQRAAEDEARRAAAAAEDEGARRAAELKAEEAAAAAQEAEAKAEEADATAAPPAPEPAPDPYGYANLTEEALLDLANGLRADLDDEKAKRKKAEEKARELKAKLGDFTGDNVDRILRLQAEVKHYKDNMYRTNQVAEDYLKQVRALKKRVADLERQLAAQEIPL